VGTRSAEGRAVFAEYADAALSLYDTNTAVGAIAKDVGVTVLTGAIEREGQTLYCSALAYDRHGTCIGHRRKLMPTAQERVIWGQGHSVGSPFDTDVGRVSALICWENYMPLARMAMYQQDIDLYAVPTVDDRDGWQHTLRHIARESGCFVLSACQYMTLEHFPGHWKEHARLPDGDVLIRGGSCVVDPMGEYICPPTYGKDALIVAEVDLKDKTKAGYDLDIVGHYARPDIFAFSWK
jgi:nitrilase